LPEEVGVHAFHAVAGVEAAVDGHAGVLGDGHLGELIATRFVDEGLHTEDLADGVVPLVQVVR